MGRGFSEGNEGVLYNRSLNKIYAKHINLQANIKRSPLTIKCMLPEIQMVQCYQDTGWLNIHK